MIDNVVINVKNLSKVYKLYDSPRDRFKETFHPFRRQYHHDFFALKDVSFGVKKGEIFGIIGKNGSGKSTLLKVLTGVLNPTEGVVKVNGKVSALLELGAGFNPEFTGIENVYLNGSIMGYSRNEMDTKLDDILAFADIGEYVKQPIKMYSSGMFARLAFAVAINVDPEILIVDETLSVGDAAFQRKCFSKMDNFRELKKTILLVSHSESVIVNLCERVILLDGGEKIFDGQPKAAINNYLRLLSMRGEKYFEFREKLKSGMSCDAEVQMQSMENQHGSAEELDRTEVHENFLDSIIEEYIPSLKSSSTVKYDSKGIELFDPQITTLQGKVVNILVHGRRYRYMYRARFINQAFGVRFGMLIKTINGVEIGGGGYPIETDKIPEIKKDTEVLLGWEFDCLLEEGTYFTNCGVLSTIDGVHDFSHRVLDACMFRVISDPERITTSMIDFKLKPTILFVNNNE